MERILKKSRKWIELDLLIIGADFKSKSRVVKRLKGINIFLRMFRIKKGREEEERRKKKGGRKCELVLRQQWELIEMVMSYSQ